MPGAGESPRRVDVGNRGFPKYSIHCTLTTHITLCREEWQPIPGSIIHCLDFSVNTEVREKLVSETSSMVELPGGGKTGAVH